MPQASAVAQQLVPVMNLSKFNTFQFASSQAKQAVFVKVTFRAVWAK